MNSFSTPFSIVYLCSKCTFGCNPNHQFNKVDCSSRNIRETLWKTKVLKIFNLWKYRFFSLNKFITLWLVLVKPNQRKIFLIVINDFNKLIYKVPNSEFSLWTKSQEPRSWLKEHWGKWIYMWFIQEENPLGPYSVPACIFLLRLFNPWKIRRCWLETGGSIYEEKRELKQTH